LPPSFLLHLHLSLVMGLETSALPLESYPHWYI
jgi:hypothetical protein